MSHTHFTYRIDGYWSPFLWPSREAVEASLGDRMFYEPVPDIFEVTSDRPVNLVEGSED